MKVGRAFSPFEQVGKLVILLNLANIAKVFFRRFLEMPAVSKYSAIL